MSPGQLKKTALYDEHVKLGAKIVPFAGWEMPVSYKGIIAEHEAVRNSCGIFDVGHMGIIDIEGKGAEEFLLRVGTNNVKLLSELQGQYSVLCNNSGGTIDDIFIFRLHDRFRLVVNASNTQKVLGWFLTLSNDYDSLIITHRKDLGILSLQGPNAKNVLKIEKLPPRNHCSYLADVLFSHTGYTGEEGYEFFVPQDRMEKTWNHFISLGVAPCGLGARDTLRLEAGLPLYGHEYNDETSPLEVGYPWAVKFDHDFIGKPALQKQKDNGTKKILVGLKFRDKAIPRQGAIIQKDGKEIGVVTSGTFSPTLKMPVALGFVQPEYAEVGGGLTVLIRETPYIAVVTKKKMI